MKAIAAYTGTEGLANAEAWVFRIAITRHSISCAAARGATPPTTTRTIWI